MLLQLASIIPEVTTAHFSLPEMEFNPTVIPKLEFLTMNVKKAKENKALSCIRQALAESITFVLPFFLCGCGFFPLN